MEEGLLFCREHYPGLQVVLTAQAHLVPFYRSFGFEPTAAHFDGYGLTHVDMELRPRD
jgi:ElaA protein